MSGFSATDAAFEGFRLTRERPKTIGVFALVLFAHAVIQSLIAYQFGGQAFADFMAMAEQDGPPDLDRMSRAMGELGTLFAIMVPVSLLVYGALLAAVHRLVLKPETTGLGIRFGRAELHQAFVAFAVTALTLLAYVATFSVGLTAALTLQQVNAPLGALIAIASLVIVVVAVLNIGVRLSLAGPLTFEAERIRIFGAWGMTKGYFWPMIGAYLLAVIFAIIVGLLGMLILGAILAIGGEELAAMANPGVASLAQIFSPGHLLFRAVSGFLSALITVILVAPTPVIYRQLRLA